MLRCGLTGIFLSVVTWQDIKRRSISGKVFLVFGLAGILVNLYTRRPAFMWITGLLTGAVVLLFGRLSEEEIGYGDGLTLLVTGLFLDWKETMGLFLVALFLCGVFGMVLLGFGRVKRRAKLPFLPFLAAGFWIEMFIACVGKG